MFSTTQGSTVTDYEPYVNPTTATVTTSSALYTPSENGTIEGIMSDALSSGISTSTEGITINVEYNKDINKVLTKISNALGIEI